ncbi:hypothetical protein ES703_08384 [subsurface metagenome]
MTVSLAAPAIMTISLLSVSPVSAVTGPYENIIRAIDTAYNIDGDKDAGGPAPWKWYGSDGLEGRPVIMAAKEVDSGAVVAAGLSMTSRNGRWNDTIPVPNPYPYLDVLFDEAFQWMTSGTAVLWYGEYDETLLDTIEYVYSDAAGCSALITSLEGKGYTVTDTISAGTFDNITPELLDLYDILVIPQMELGEEATGGDPTLLPDSVVATIEDFVRTGGGLLIMEGYDSFGYNYSRVQNKILRALDMGMYFQSDTIQDETNYWGSVASYWQPLADVDNTTSIGSAYETATGGTTIGVYGMASLAEKGDIEISAGISPEYKSAFPNTTVEYTVSVSAAGWENDTINLSVDNVWPATLGTTSFANVQPDEIKETTLTVTIPSDTVFGDEDEITVTATSQTDNTVSTAVKCKAIVSMRIGPPTEDTYTTQWAQEAGKPLGAYIWMQVGSDLDNNKRIYLKFDLSAIPEGLIPPDDVQIDDIRARLFIHNEIVPTYAAAGKNVNIYEVNDDTWQEDAMWWEENEPENGALLGTTPVTEEDLWYSWDVTAHVIDEFRNDNIASFLLRAEEENLEGTPAFEYYSFATANATETWAHPYLIIGYDVSTWISPDYDGLRGGTLTYNVNVWNRGSETDNYDLYIDNVWETTLENRLLNVEPMEIRTAKLTVKIDELETIGDNDTILITAVSEHSGENDNGTCIARAWTNVSSWEDSSTMGCDDPPHHLENSVWGRATGIYVGRDYEGAAERGWLKFDLRAFPAGTTITRANLYLNSYSTYGANVRVYGVGDDSWSEYTIKWTDKPSIDTDNALDTRAVLENDKWYSWDVTDFVVNENAGDKVVSFCLVDIGENVAPDHDARFSSKEWGDNVPYLEILDTAPNTDVRALAKPIFQGGVGTTLTHTITVVNKGDSTDSFDLSVEETEAWGSYLSDTTLSNIASGDNSTTTLNVPVGGSVCTTNDITISVVSQENSAIYDNIVCSAHHSDATLGLKTLYDVSLNLNILLRDDASELVLKFYTWGDAFQDENLVWSTMPAHLVDVKDIPHPQVGVAVQKTELVLTDAEGATISTFATFIVDKVDLEMRFMDIPSYWAAAPPARKIELEMEFMEIPSYWAGAPSS